jgi:diaminopimelate epimerase
VVIDNRDGAVPAGEARALARAVCRRRIALGADGVILVSHPTTPDTAFHWWYINADGSDGDLCGNGAMCGARFAVDRGIAPPANRFSTPVGIVSATVMPEARVAIDLVASGPIGERVTIDGRPCDHVVVGVPHSVTITDDADACGDFDAWGRSVRHHPAFAPAGANANLIHIVDSRTIRMRTWERGVEAETLACGTGAAAAAIVAHHHGLVETPVSVLTSGGRPIVVEFQREGDRATGIRITGSARYVATGILHREALA